MHALSEFLAMGGYAGYVWPAYGLTFLVLAAILVSAIVGARRAARRLAELEQAAPGRRNQGAPE